MNQYRDRGNKKWTAMMLPEHMEALKAWGQEQERIERERVREWDEQELEEFQQKITDSYQERTPLVFEIKHHEEKEYITGIVTGFDQANNRITIEHNGEAHQVPVWKITNILTL